VARIIGLTGGIASGKSTVSAMLGERGAAIVDADQIARRVVAPGTPALALLVRQFGAGILAADGSLDRARLGAIAFADAEARRALEAITHPYIRAASQVDIATHIAAGAEIVVYEAALLVENRLHAAPWMHALLVVAVPPELQIARLCQRDGLDPAAARARLAAQLPLADKVAVADFVIDNAGSREETRDQVDALWPRLRADAATPADPPPCPACSHGGPSGEGER
jgi:dephospho-CoA kinase